MSHVKIPDTNHDIHPLIKERWSARSFSDKPIKPETLEGLFEAASWAASSMNEQPWRYIYAHRDSKGFQTLFDCLMEGNQKWVKTGAVLMVALAKKTFDRNGKTNRHYMHDTGAANTTMLLQATHEGIYGHMMGGFHMDKTIEDLDIDTDQWEPVCFIVLGYLDDADKLEEPFREREKKERSRNSVDTFTKQL